MVCLRNVCVNTLHKGDSIFTNNNNNNNNIFTNNNNDNNILNFTQTGSPIFTEFTQTTIIECSLNTNMEMKLVFMFVNTAVIRKEISRSTFKENYSLNMDCYI
jgi:hypothetical protein